MGKKVLTVCRESYWTTFRIEVPAEQPVFQVHRLNMGIDFKANAQAREALSPNAYMLYMFLVSGYPNRIWTLSSQRILKDTTLSEDEADTALQELSEQGYWTKGEISVEGQTYRSNAFHIWESPAMNSSQA